MNLRPDGLVHLVQHLSQGQIHPAVSFARAINDPAFERRFGFGQRAVEQMDGTLGVESKPGDGSSFWFELNRAD